MAPTAVGERTLRPRVGRSPSLAQRKAGQSQVPARCHLAGSAKQRIGQTGDEAGCKEGPHREDQGVLWGSWDTSQGCSR